MPAPRDAAGRSSARLAIVPAPRDAAGRSSARLAMQPVRERLVQASHHVLVLTPFPQHFLDQSRWAQSDCFASLWILERVPGLVAFLPVLIPELLHYRRPTTDDCLLWRDHDDCL